MKKLWIVAVVGMLVACGDGEQHAPTSTQTADPLDSIRALVMAAHDVAMPKMGKLAGYQKTLLQKIDSLKAAGAPTELLAQYERTLTLVAAAEKGMNDWMDQFEYDPDIAVDSAKLYLTKQQILAENMRDDVLGALDSAAALLGK